MSILQELKLQAGIDANPDQEGLDLFAELIIKQSAKFMDEYADRTGRDLLEHFRVDIIDTMS
jgi:hypothetical protein